MGLLQSKGSTGSAGDNVGRAVLVSIGSVFVCVRAVSTAMAWTQFL